jgi:hypothetical protein
MPLNDREIIHFSIIKQKGWNEFSSSLISDLGIPSKFLLFDDFIDYLSIYYPIDSTRMILIGHHDIQKSVLKYIQLVQEKYEYQQWLDNHVSVKSVEKDRMDDYFDKINEEDD